jgi:hypothetical protein
MSEAGWLMFLLSSLIDLEFQLFGLASKIYEDFIQFVV